MAQETENSYLTNQNPKTNTFRELKVVLNEFFFSHFTTMTPFNETCPEVL